MILDQTLYYMVFKINAICWEIFIGTNDSEVPNTHWLSISICAFENLCPRD